MKVFIMTDLEGISGVDDIKMIDESTEGYQFAIKRLVCDINATVDGAFLGGATEVVVRDGHASGKNITQDMIDPRAHLDTTHPYGYTGILDETFDVAFQIGAHARAGTINAFLDHTQNSSTVYNLYINGIVTGEIGQFATACSHFDIPTLMVSGDEAACNEARELLPMVQCAAVKYGIGRNKAHCYDYDLVADKIRNAAKDAMALVGKVKPKKHILPLELKMEMYRADYCDDLMYIDGIERLSPRSLRLISDSLLGVLFR